MKIKIELKKRHPRGYMFFGRHTITTESQEIELNKEEIEDLKNDGPKTWFKFVEVKATAPKPVKPAKNKDIKK